jgi:hypothetical protein
MLFLLSSPFAGEVAAAGRALRDNATNSRHVIARRIRDEAIQSCPIMSGLLRYLAMTAPHHHTIIITGLSISVLNVPINSAPSAPSTAR